MLKKILLVVIGLALVACSSNLSNKVGDKGYDAQMEAYEGQTVRISDFQGKNTLIVAWSTT